VQLIFIASYSDKCNKKQNTIIIFLLKIQTKYLHPEPSKNIVNKLNNHKYLGILLGPRGLVALLLLAILKNQLSTKILILEQIKQICPRWIGHHLSSSKILQLVSLFHIFRTLSQPRPKSFLGHNPADPVPDPEILRY